MQSIVDILISLRDAFNGELLFAISMLLLGGWFFGWLAEKLKLPAVTGYLVAGLFLGDSITGIINFQMSAPLKTITDIALGIIAITIGAEFSAKKIKLLGKKILIVTVVQLLAAFVAVTIGLYVFKLPLIYSLILGAIGTATAPAATVVIIQNLRARGEFVDMLYGIVALDDAGCVIIFAIVYAAADSVIGVGVESVGVFRVVFNAVEEIGFAIIVGLGGGGILHYLVAKKTNSKEVMIISLGMIIFITTICVVYNLSSLLANMTAGTLLINLSDRNARIFHSLEPLTIPLYAAFFAIAGTEIKLNVFKSLSVLLYGTIFVIMRFIGKYFGVRFSAALSGCDHKTQKYLGYAMLPQAGVAIGLILYIQASPLSLNATPDVRLFFDQIINIVFFSTMINELVGPPISEYAIKRGADL